MKSLEHEMQKIGAQYGLSVEDLSDRGMIRVRHGDSGRKCLIKKSEWGLGAKSAVFSCLWSMGFRPSPLTADYDQLKISGA